MKMRYQPNILFLPLLLIFCQSCGEAAKKKDYPINITTNNQTEFLAQETIPGNHAYEAGFEDETRSQSNNFDNTAHNWQGSVSYSSLSVNNTRQTVGSRKPVRKEKKVIKNGTIRIETNTFSESKKRIDNVVKTLGGYYENEELEKSDYRIQYHLIIRLPSKNFEQLVQGIENGKDEIVLKKIYTNDVTEEFLDIETRLENKRRYLKRYKELLEKAGNVNEILSIEENIRQLMEEIESKEGRLKYLNDQVDLSTLRINLFKEYPVKINKPVKDPFSSRAGDSLEKGWNSIINFLLWTVSKWPIILVIGILAWIVRKKWKKRQAANNK